MSFTGKYIYAHPEHKKTCEVESNIQRTIKKVSDRHGPAVIGDTSAMRHFTCCFGCTGNTKVIEEEVKVIVASLLAKHGKTAFTLRVQQYMFCPGPAPIVAVTPKKCSVDWNFFTELQASLLMNPKINAAHPDYVGSDKITDEKKFPAGFLDLKKAIDNGAALEEAAHQWMWPHMSAFQLKDSDIVTFGSLNREVLNEKYGWIEDEEIDIEVPIRIIGASLQLDGQKFRLEIELK